MTAHWPVPAGLHTTSARLPVESRLPSFGGATGWLNSPPLTPASLRGNVVLVNFGANLQPGLEPLGPGAADPRGDLREAGPAGQHVQQASPDGRGQEQRPDQGPAVSDGQRPGWGMAGPGGPQQAA